MLKILLFSISALIATATEASSPQKIFCNSSRSTIDIEYDGQAKDKAHIDVLLVAPVYSEYQGEAQIIDSDSFVQINFDANNGFLIIEKKPSIEGGYYNATLFWKRLDLFGKVQKDFNCLIGVQ